MRRTWGFAVRLQRQFCLEVALAVLAALCAAANGSCILDAVLSQKGHFWPLWDTRRSGLVVLSKISELACSPPQNRAKFELLPFEISPLWTHFHIIRNALRAKWLSVACQVNEPWQYC